MQENEVLWPFNEMKFALKSLLWKRIEKFRQVLGTQLLSNFHIASNHNENQP